MTGLSLLSSLVAEHMNCGCPRSTDVTIFALFAWFFARGGLVPGPSAS
jgi:hypothetical protein